MSTSREELATQEFPDLRSANSARQKEWDAGNQITLAYRGNELAGEVGEACNIIKKLERERMGIRGSRASVNDLGDELADVVICADLIAMDAGIDLQAAIARKFNATSENVGLTTRLAAAPKAGVDHTPTSNSVVHPDIAEALAQACEYFENRTDVVDGDYGVPEPNTEMRLAQMCSDALDRISILPSVLGGVDQPRSADGRHSNEQSGRNLSRAPKKISDDYVTVEYINAYGGRCRDCADHDGTCPNSGLPCNGRHKAVEHVIAAINYGWANGYLPSTLDNAETDASKCSECRPPAVLSAPNEQSGKQPSPAWQPIETAPTDRRIMYHNGKTTDAIVGYCRYCVFPNGEDRPYWWDYERDDEACPKFWMDEILLPRPQDAPPPDNAGLVSGGGSKRDATHDA